MNHNSVEVLLVEDNPSDAELTIRELKKHHYRLESAKAPAEAKQQSAGEFEIIIIV